MKRISILILALVLGALLIPHGWVSLGAPNVSGSLFRQVAEPQRQNPPERLVALSQLDSLPVADQGDVPVSRDPRRWRALLGSKVNQRFQEVFPGVDLVFAGTAKRMEAILIVKPGVDPASVVFNFPQAEAIGADAQANIWVATPGGDLGFMRPLLSRQNEKVSGSFAIQGSRVALQVQDHDAAQPLLVRFDVVFPERPVNLLDQILYRTFKAENYQPTSPAAPEQTTTVTATKAVDNANTAPGGTLMYTVTITNTGASTATGVQFTDTISNNTTLVGGSVASSPIGQNDSYTATGNIPISPTNGVLANDIDPDTGNNTGLTVTQVQGLAGNVGVATNTTATGIGGVTGSVNVASNGSFTYEPPPGFTGNDTFSYRVADASGKFNDATVTITISNMVWFISNTGGGLNRGTFTNPFTTIGAFNTANTGAAPNPQPGHHVVLLPAGGTYNETDGINLRDNQTLTGSAVAFNTVFPGADANSTAAYTTFAASTGAAPTINATAGDAVDLALNNAVRGLNVGNTPGFFGFDGTAVGNLTIATVNKTGTGGAINVSTSGAFGSTVNFGTLESSSSPTHNINLVGVTGTLGVVSGGTGLSNSAGNSANVRVSGGSVSLTYPGNVSKANAGPMVTALGGHTGTLTFQTGTLSATNGSGLQFDNADGTYNFNGTTTLSGGAVVNIINGSGGAFTFGTGTSITAGNNQVPVTVDGGTAAVTYSGGITKTGNGDAVRVQNGHATGTITFQTGTLNITDGNGLQFDNADSTYNFSGTTMLNGGDAAIDIFNGSAGNFTFSANTSVTNPSGTAFRVDGANGTITYNGTLSKTGSSGGRLIDLSNRTGGSVSFTGTLTNTATGATGIIVQNNTSGSPSFTFSGATKTLDTSSNTAVTLSNNNTATISFTNGGLDIDTTTGTGFDATNNGTINVSGANNTITSTSGRALNLANITAGMTFATISSTNSGTTGASLSTVSGNLTVTTTSVTNPTGIGISVGSSVTGGTFNFGTTSVSGSGGTGVSLTSNANSITFGDLDISPDANQRAFHATSNTGALTSTSGSITGVSNAVAVEIVGVSIASRTPLNMQLTDVSANGGANGIILTNTSTSGSPGGFRILGNGGACTNATPTCTGGTIQSMTANGVFLTSTIGVSLNLVRILNVASVASGTCSDLDVSGCRGALKMTGTAAAPVTTTGLTNVLFSGSGGEGVTGFEVRGFKIEDSEVRGFAQSNTYNGIRVFNLSDITTGQNLIEDTIIDGLATTTPAPAAGVHIRNTSTTSLSDLSIRRGTIRGVEDGIRLTVRDASNSSFLVTNVSMPGELLGDGVDLAVGNAGDTGPIGNIIVQNNTLENSGFGFGGIVLATVERGRGTWTVRDNTIRNNGGTAINIAPWSKFNTSTAVVARNIIDCPGGDGTIPGNTNTANPCRVGIGISVSKEDGGGAGENGMGQVYLDSNTISRAAVAIGGIIRTGLSAGGRLDMRVRNNIFTNNTGNPAILDEPMQFDAGSSGGPTGTMCLNIATANSPAGGNNDSAAGAFPGSDSYRIRERAGATFLLQGLANGSSAATTDTFVANNNKTNGATPATVFVSSTGGVLYDGGTCTTPTEVGAVPFGPAPSEGASNLEELEESEVSQLFDQLTGTEPLWRKYFSTRREDRASGDRSPRGTDLRSTFPFLAAFTGTATAADSSRSSEKPASLSEATEPPSPQAAPAVESGGSRRIIGQLMRPVLSAYAVSRGYINPLKWFEPSASAAPADTTAAPPAIETIEEKSAPEGPPRLSAQDRPQRPQRTEGKTDAPQRQQPRPPTRILASPESGETVMVGPFDLPPGESVQIMFSVTVTGTTGCSVSNQATVSGTNFTSVTTNAAVTSILQAPSAITCPTNITGTTDPGQCTSVETFATPTTSAGCPTPTVTCVPASGFAFPVGITTVTCTAANSQGSTNCSFTVTITDNQVPALTCPAPISVNTAPGVCTATATYAPTIMDNCPGATAACVPPSGSTFNIGVTTVNCTGMDANGNSAAPCSFTVTVVDNQDPTISACPTNIVLPATTGACSATATYTPPTAMDNCGPAPVVCAPASGSTFLVGTTTVTCTATDSSNRTASCSFTVTIQDTEAPTIMCPANQTVSSNVPVVVNYPAPTANDNCGAPTVNCVPASGTTFAVGTTTVTCTASDTSAQSADATCTFTVNVIPCTVNCPGNQTAIAPTGACAATVNYPAPTTTGTCGTVTCSPISGASFPVGITTVTCTSMAGPSCSFTVTVTDNQLPTLTCPTNIVTNTAPNTCAATVTYTTPTPSDNCPGATVTCVPASGSSFVRGVTTVTCTATDASNNMAACTFTVTVNDNQNPAITCPANISVNAAAGQCSATATYTTPTPTDNCPGATASCTPASGSTFAVGTTTVTCTATDASNNTASCTFTVTVTDNQNPTVTCPANITQPATTGACNAVVTYTVPTASDNCPGATVACVPNTGSTFNVGTTTVTCTATDASNRTGTCTFTVTVNDTQNPTVTCPTNITTNTAPNTCAANVTYTVPTASDNCSGATVTCTPSSGSSFLKGTTTVTCTAKDASNNMAMCTFTVTVNDNQNPAITCPANITLNTGAGICTAVATYTTPTPTDNCPGATAACVPASGSTFQKGVTTVTCTATDASNNTASCTFTVTVNDNQNPAITCPANIALNTAPGLCTAVATFTTPTPTDNCPGATAACVPASGSTFQKGVTTVTCTATDASNNTANCTFTVTVTDNQNPTITCPANQTATSLGGPVAVTYPAPTATDNCPGVTTACVPASGSVFPLGTTTVNCTATDAVNRTATCSFTVTVITCTSITCPTDIFVGTTGNSTTVNYTLPTANGNCGTITCTPASGSTFNVGVTTVSCSSSIGNQTCAFRVTVNRVSGSVSDPLACTGPGNTVSATLVISNNGNVNQTVADTTTFTNLVGVPGSCTVSPNIGTCAVTNGSLTYNGTLTPGQTVTISYLTQVSDLALSGAQVCTNNSVTFNGGSPFAFSVCDVVDCPVVGPGGPFPARAEASDQKAGSVLIYNIYTSGVTNANTQNTRINLTNSHLTLPSYVHLFFVSEGCAVADSFICLTGNQTASFLASDLDPGTTGYLVAVAVDALGCPTNFNYLMGDEYVKFSTGHAANLAAEAFAALPGGLTACDSNSNTATINFDGVNYNRAPATLALGSVGARADGNDTLLIINRIGGNLGIGASSLGTLFGLLYDDTEASVSFNVTGSCQLRSSLTNNFPRTTPRFETFIPAGRTGWLKIYNQTGAIGITGSAINFNPNASSSAGAFNQGHNLHHLTLNNSMSYIIPVFPPSC